MLLDPAETVIQQSHGSYFVSLHYPDSSGVGVNRDRPEIIRKVVFLPAP